MDHDSHMAADSAMQADTQSKLYNLLGGLKTAKIPATPIPASMNTSKETNNKHTNSSNKDTLSSRSASRDRPSLLLPSTLQQQQQQSDQERLHSAALGELGVSILDTSSSQSYSAHNKSFDSHHTHSPHHSPVIHATTSSGSASYESVPMRPVYSKSTSTEATTRDLLNGDSYDADENSMKKGFSVRGNEGALHFDVVSVSAHPKVIKDHNYGQDSSFNNLFKGTGGKTAGSLDLSMSRNQTLDDEDMDGLGSVDAGDDDSLKLGQTPCCSSDSRGETTASSDVSCLSQTDKQDSFGFDVYGGEEGATHQTLKTNSSSNSNSKRNNS
jgi:hypothetical protein